MELFSADDCAFRGVPYYRIVSSLGLSGDICHGAPLLQQPLDLTYSAVFMEYLSRYRNYGGLWDVKKVGGKDER